MKSSSLLIHVFKVFTFIYMTCYGTNADNCINSWKTRAGELKQWEKIKEQLLKILPKENILKSADNHFTLAACKDPSSGTRPDAKGGIWDSTSKLIIGSSADAELETKNGTSWVALHLSTGDSCSVKYGSTTVSINHTSIVLFTCGKSDIKPTLSQVGQNAEETCQHIFVVSSNYVCDLLGAADSSNVQTTIAAPKAALSSSDVEITTKYSTTAVTSTSETHNHGGIKGVELVFIMLVLLVLIYFAIGCAYKRYVLGARGFEQLPNYVFWLRLARFAQSLIGGSSDRRTDGRLVGDGNFRYDQPPLLAADDDWLDQDNDDRSALTTSGRRRPPGPSSYGGDTSATANESPDVRLLVV